MSVVSIPPITHMINIQSDSGDVPDHDAQNGQNAQNGHNQVHQLNINVHNGLGIVAEEEKEGVQLDENNLTVMSESPSSRHETTGGDPFAGKRPNSPSESDLEQMYVQRPEQPMQQQTNGGDMKSDADNELPIMMDDSEEAIYRKVALNSPFSVSEATATLSPTRGSNESDATNGMQSPTGSVATLNGIYAGDGTEYL